MLARLVFLTTPQLVLICYACRHSFYAASQTFHKSEKSQRSKTGKYPQGILNQPYMEHEILRIILFYSGRLNITHYSVSKNILTGERKVSHQICISYLQNYYSGPCKS